jgi:hypothetical protein
MLNNGLKVEATASHPEVNYQLPGFIHRIYGYAEQVESTCSYLFSGGERRLVKICS